MTRRVTLFAIDPHGVPQGHVGALPELANDALRATAQLYEAVRHEPPWIGYLASCDSIAVGMCGFKSPPIENRVEIAYFTFPEFEGSGIASAMAAQLVAIATNANPKIEVAAQTLPERNASHRILEKLGFRHIATIDHPDDGVVWEWRLTCDPNVA